MFADINKNSFSYFNGREIVERDPIDLEDMQAHLSEFPQIECVEFPQTWFGYGATIVALSNGEYLTKYHADETAIFNTAYWLKRDEFFKEDSELVELFFRVKNEYPVIDDELYWRMEYEALNEFLADEMRYRLEIDLVDFERAMSELELSAIDFARIDNDGSTVYADNSDLDDLEERINAHL